MRLKREWFYGRRRVSKKLFEDCLKRGKLKEFKIPKKRILIEIKAAEDDLEEAKDRLDKKKYKYATIRAYYSLFHSARTLLYLKGYREKSHYCLKTAIEVLYVKENLVKPILIEYFEEALGLREAADYQSVFSRSGALRSLRGAKRFLLEAKRLLGKK